MKQPVSKEHIAGVGGPFTGQRGIRYDRRSPKAPWPVFLFLPIACLSAALASAAVSSTSSGLVQSSPRNQYAAIKRTMEGLYSKGMLNSHIDIPEEHHYDFVRCEENGSMFLGPGRMADEVVLTRLADLAADVVVWSHDFTKLGIPQAAWRPLIAELETSQLTRRLASGAGSDSDSLDEQYYQERRRLAVALERYRRGNPRLPTFLADGGCGGFELSVHLATDPRGGRVWFIPVFFYELCKVQGLDPDDRERCDRWREALDGVLVEVSGDYVYEVRWPDGAKRRGRVGFNNLDVDEHPRIVIHKP